MKINEAAEAVGVSSKNIRYYESEGLLSPERNRENNYRDYTQSDIVCLRQIKLLRKLAMPIEEIRAVLRGELALSDAMHRNTVRLEKNRRSVEQAQAFCAELRDSGLTLAEIDPAVYLSQMARLEQSGVDFMNNYKKEDIRRIAAPVAAAIVMIALMAALAGLFIWTFVTDPAEAPPLLLVVILTALPLVVIVGIVIALVQRLQEIRKGEIDAAGKY